LHDNGRYHGSGDGSIDTQAGNLNRSAIGFSNIGNASIPASFALIFAVIIGIIFPIITYIWLRNIDEQELHAYKEGSFWALHIYMIGAPIWWILWRGGITSPPDGILIYLIVNLTVVTIWFQKKYL
jgi:hypothetical protein